MLFGLSVEVWLGFIRHLLTGVGGLLVSYGLMDESTVVSVVGGVMTVIGFAASWWVKTGNPE